MLIKSIIRKRKLRIFIDMRYEEVECYGHPCRKKRKNAVSLNLQVMDDLEPIYSDTRWMMKLFLKYRALTR